MKRKNLAPNVRTRSLSNLPRTHCEEVRRTELDPRELGLCAHGVEDHADCIECRSNRCCGGTDCSCDQAAESAHPDGFQLVI